MIPYEKMPEDNADLARISVDFPRLTPDVPMTCPVTSQEILDYLALEAPDGEMLTWEELTFIRTADVEGTAYWIWRFHEQDKREAYCIVSKSLGGRITIGYDENWYGLSPEQFILGHYHDVF